MIYKYYLYGINVQSEIEIEEAYARDFDTEADVKVVLGQMPDDVKKMYADKSLDDWYFATSARELAFRVPNVADYWVTSDTITVNPFKNAKKSDVKCFILGSCFGYCMFLRKKVVMHGNNYR